MPVLKTECDNGHALQRRSLRAMVPCRGCSEMTSTVYDCDHRCYGHCAECWVENVCGRVAKVMALHEGDG